MPTRAEVQAQLTGPGGMFEVITDEVDGIEMLLYKNRMISLREVAAAGQARGDAEGYVVYGERRYGFGTFVSLANSVSHSLVSDFGVLPGDRVAILSANNPEWCLAFWGAVNLGAVVVGLNGWWKTDEILYGLADSGSKILVADRARFERVADELDSLAGLEAVFLIDAVDGETADFDKRVHRFDELTARPTAQLPHTPIAEGDPAVIFYTSGTTGRPKGAISTHRSMIANLQNTVMSAVAGAMSAGAGSTLAGTADSVRQTSSLLTSPLFHVAGCHSTLVVGMLAGVKLVIPEGKFDPVKAMQLIQDEQISVWATVPTMVLRAVEHPDRHNFDLSSVTQVAYGGSPSAGELQRMVRETFPNVRSLSNVYGLTESSSAVTINTGAELDERPDSVGRAMPIVDLKIVDGNGRAVPTGATGEVWVKGPQIMPGYWGKPEATAECITDGWLHSGDIGYLDEEGYLYITDRAKDMIIRGGENIYCVEIENRLVEHPDILDAAVIGVAHHSLGEEVKAVVSVAHDVPLDAATVRAWVAETLANFKVPEYVEITTEKLPRNASGKLLKNILRGKGEVSFAETM